MRRFSLTSMLTLPILAAALTVGLAGCGGGAADTSGGAGTDATSSDAGAADDASGSDTTEAGSTTE